MGYPFRKIEKKWTKKWQESGIYEPDLSASRRKPFYNLMMFPYPSAEGLHVGNMYAFTGSDIYGRFQRMQGNDVFEPIGLDGFGIHSENYALKIGTHPAEQAKVSEKNFYRQLQSIGNGFAWNERLETYDPEYYKWTQWIFIQLFKRGLAYRKKQSVNWCPSCKTVLADEQVINGACERCSTKVIKKELEQWFFRITKYADRLLKGLDGLDWSERIKVAQRNWIGKSEGAIIRFPIVSRTNAESHADRRGKDQRKSASSLRESAAIAVFTTRPDTIFGATYLVLSPEHEEITNHKSQITNWKQVDAYIKKAKTKSEEERIVEGKAKTGIELKGIKAINPATKKEIPIWIADFVLAGYGTGAVFADAHDERDFAFAKRYRLPLKPTLKTGNAEMDRKIKNLEECFTGDGILYDSGKFSGMTSARARKEITKEFGISRTQYKLRDWLISRQRYWGPPIPMIFCLGSTEASAKAAESCDWQPVPEKDLPVKLPLIKNFRPTGKGESPLASVKSFYETKCPKCGGKARRETDVSDTFLDSSWYFFRYLDHKNKKEIFDKKKVKHWLPVDAYIGGAEHAVLHLLYSRFITMALHDIGIVDFSAKGGSASGGDEPYKKFRAHGLLISEGAKMSKSKGNVVVPDVYIQKFGADAIRLYLMFLGPFEQGGDWRDAGIMGPVRFLDRAWALAGKWQMAKGKESKTISPWMHSYIKEITEDIKELKYNTAISELMVVLNKLEKEALLNKKDFETFLLLLAPFAPFIIEEMYQDLQRKSAPTPHRARSGAGSSQRKSAFVSVHEQKWPKYDVKHLTQDTFILIVQVNGKLRGQVNVNRGITQKEAEKLALADPRVKKYTEGKKIKKTVFVKDRLINFVV